MSDQVAVRHQVEPLLALGEPGESLRLVASRQPFVPPGGIPWFDVELNVEASPFGGTVTDTLTATDLQEWATALSHFDRDETAPRQAILGGGRALSLSIVAEPQTGGEVGAFACAIEVTPSGDDPFPLLRFVIFDVEPFWAGLLDRIQGLIK